MIKIKNILFICKWKTALFIIVLFFFFFFDYYCDFSGRYFRYSVIKHTYSIYSIAINYCIRRFVIRKYPWKISGKIYSGVYMGEWQGEGAIAPGSTFYKKKTNFPYRIFLRWTYRIDVIVLKSICYRDTNKRVYTV